jgi:molybdopterin synthase sulfur carrier subunit
LEISVLTFGVVREIAGAQAIAIEIGEEMTVAVLRREMTASYPRIGELRSFAIAINGAYAADADVIHAGDEVAVIPPVSGG